MARLGRLSTWRAIGALCLAAAGVTCREAGVTAPLRPVALSLAPRFDIAPDAPAVPFTKIYAAVYHLPGLELADSQTVDVGDSASVGLALAVRVVTYEDLFRVVLAGIDANGDTVYRASVDSVRAASPDAPLPPPTVITLTYSGRDTVVHAVHIAPVDTQLVVGDTLHYRAVALDANGNTVSGVALRFVSRDPASIGVTNAGAATALAATAGSWVVVATANGTRDSTRVVITSTPVVQSITANGPFSFTALHDSTQVVAVAHDRNGQAIPGAAFTYSAPDAAVSVSGTGMVTAQAVGTGRVVIRSGTVADTVQATVTQAPASLAVHPDTITLTALGDSSLATFGVLDHNGFTIPGAAVSWASRSTSTATVSAAGYVRAVANGQAYVVATTGGLADSLLAVVRQSVATLTATPDTIRLLAPNDTARITTAMTDANGHPVTGVTPTFTSADTTVAKVDAAGLVRLAGYGATTVTVGAGGATATVRVRSTIARVAAGSAQSFSAFGDTARLTPSAFDDHNAVVSGATFAYATRNAAVATVSASGLITAAGNGSTWVVASAGGVSDSVSVSVSQVPATLSMSLGSLVFSALGQAAPLSATVRDHNGFIIASPPISFASRNAAVATFSGGTVTAIDNGSTHIVATSGAAHDSTLITVSQVVASVTLSRDTLRLTNVGDTATLVATVLDANSHPVTNTTTTWTTADATVASVNASGLVTLTGAGVANVTATAGAKSATTVVIKTPADVPIVAAVAYLRLTPGVDTVYVGDTLLEHADFVDANGVATWVSPLWASDNPGRVSIDAAGHVVARDTGTVTITATQNAVTGHATIVVRPAPVLTAFSFLPGAVNGITTSTARLSVHIDGYDEGSGISSMQVTFTAPDNSTQSCTALSPTYGSTLRGGWDCVLTLPAGSTAGTWRATQLVLSGSIVRTLDEQAIATLGATTLTVNP